MADRNDLVFKKIVNRKYTSADNAWYEEDSGVPFKLNAIDVWISNIPSTPPASDTAVVKGYRLGSELSLVHNTAVNNRKAWYCEIEGNPAGSFISPRYGQGYNVQVYKGSSRIDLGVYGWFFDYETGILTFDQDPGSSDIKIIAYRYTGKTVADIESTTGGSVWQGPVLAVVTVPTETTTGSRYLVKATATGVFAGQENKLAEFDGVSWQFVVPEKGMITYAIAEDRLYVYDDEGTGTWSWSGVDSVDLDYDNADSELDATSVKGAIDEIVERSLIYDSDLFCIITDPVKTI
jgi:hypothetical protein